jgi:hypothetical protein
VKRSKSAFGTLAEEAVDTIRNRILDMTLEPANRGAYVRRLDFEDVQALFDIYFVEARMLGYFVISPIPTWSRTWSASTASTRPRCAPSATSTSPG